MWVSVCVCLFRVPRFFWPLFLLREVVSCGNASQPLNLYILSAFLMMLDRYVFLNDWLFDILVLGCFMRGRAWLDMFRKYRSYRFIIIGIGYRQSSGNVAWFPILYSQEKVAERLYKSEVLRFLQFWRKSSLN